MLPVDQDTKPASAVTANGQCYISLADAIQIYRVSRRTLYNWMNSGKVQFAYSPGGSRYLLLSSLALKSSKGETLELNVPPSRYEFLDVR